MDDTTSHKQFNQIGIINIKPQETSIENDIEQLETNYVNNTQEIGRDLDLVKSLSEKMWNEETKNNLQNQIKTVSWLLSSTSLIDHITWSFPYSTISAMDHEYGWGLRWLIFALVIQFVFPTQFLTPFLFHKLFRSYKNSIIIIGRLGQLLGISQMIYSFYNKSYWIYVLSRIINYKFLIANKTASNNVCKILEFLSITYGGAFKFFVAEMSLNEVLSVTGSIGIWRDLEFHLFKDSMTLLPAYLCLGLQFISFVLSIMLVYSIRSQDSQYENGIIKIKQQLFFQEETEDNTEEQSNMVNQHENQFRNQTTNHNIISTVTQQVHKISDIHLMLSTNNMIEHNRKFVRPEKLILSRVMQVFYFITSCGLQIFPFIWILIGEVKFNLNWTFQSIIVMIFATYLLKKQPNFFGLSITGYGYLPLIFSSFFTMLGFLTIAFAPKESEFLGYLGIFLQSFSCLSIDLVQSNIYATAWRTNALTFYNTWFQCIVNLTSGFGQWQLTIYFDTFYQDKFDQIMFFLGQITGINVLVCLIWGALEFNRIDILEDF